MSTQWSIGEPRMAKVVNIPKPKWHMDFFGDGNLNFNFIKNKNWWARMWCTIIFGTKWKRL